MTTPRIEDMVEVEKTIDEEIDEVIDALVADVHFEKTWPSHTAYYQIDLNQFQDKLRKALTEAYQAGIDEAVSKQNLKWVNGKLVSQYIGIQWDGNKIIETHVDDIGGEPQEDLPDLLEMITEKMSGKYSGSYSIKVVRSYQEGQMSHPDTGQWDFPPYYEVDDFYYRRDDVYGSDYKILDDTIKALRDNK